MAFESGGGAAKRRRVDEQGGEAKGVAAAAAPLVRISALPDELRQRILTYLPLKDATRTAALAQGWRDLWRTRWAHRSSIEIHLRSSDAPQRELDALEREPRPRRRLDGFTLVTETCKLKPTQLRRFLDYAAECRVEDLHVEMRSNTLAEKLKFHMPLSSPILARLSLRCISISNMFFKGAQPFHSLAVIQLHYVNISQAASRKMMALCPSLLTLDLRGCDCVSFFNQVQGLLRFPPNLRNVTIAECDTEALLYLVLHLPGLRSFRYSGKDRGFSLPSDAALEDLHICLDSSISDNRDTYIFNTCLPDDLSGLTILTICSNALPLPTSSSKSMEGSLDEVVEEPGASSSESMEGSLDEVVEERRRIAWITLR